MRGTNGIDGKPFVRVLVIDCQFYILLMWMLQEEPGEKSERKRSRRIKARKRGAASESEVGRVPVPVPRPCQNKHNTTTQVW